ncbi:hypothetical protein KLEB273_gp163 [Bacillus phage vB_BauM_KLEB27-3]|nr:hypothetical protein KLEB273_gp163 [Bacillus phage vB_BauM_KLEB27-3]
MEKPSRYLFTLKVAVFTDSEEKAYLAKIKIKIKASSEEEAKQQAIDSFKELISFEGTQVDIKSLS